MKTPTLLRLAALCGFTGQTWTRWRSILALLTPAIRELFVIAGRGSGKSRVVALLAVSYAVRTYKRAPGEVVSIGIFAPDKKQAAITFAYIRGLFNVRPELAALIVSEARERLELRGGVVVEVLTASAAAPRGRSYALAVVEEAAFLPVDDTSSDPDSELVRALRPGLARVPGSLLAVVSSPYRRAGILWEAWRAGSSEDRLVVTADTLSLNPSFDRREVERAFATDPVSAASEFGRDGEISFRSDVSSLLDEAALAAVVKARLRELRPDSERLAFAHFDAATGSGSDSAALAIAFAPTSPGAAAELAAVRRWKPPFSPSRAIAEAAAFLRAYGIRKLSIDRFAPGLVAEFFKEHGIDCTVSERDTSTAFVELLALINSERVCLLDEPTLISELRRLERRPSTNGRDAVSHPTGAHDDVAAAAAQALALAASTKRPKKVGGTWGNPATGRVGGEPVGMRAARAAFGRAIASRRLDSLEFTSPRPDSPPSAAPSPYASPFDNRHR